MRVIWALLIFAILAWPLFALFALVVGQTP